MSALITTQIIVVLVLVALLLVVLREERALRKESMLRGRIEGAWQGKEKRQYVRLPAPVALHARYALATTRPLKRSIQIRDISQGGIGFLLDEKLAVGEKLYLEIAPEKDATPIRGQGEVRWVEEGPRQKTEGSETRTFLTGIMFISLDPRDQEKFDRYLGELLTQEKPKAA